MARYILLIIMATDVWAMLSLGTSFVVTIFYDMAPEARVIAVVFTEAAAQAGNTYGAYPFPVEAAPKYLYILKIVAGTRFVTSMFYFCIQELLRRKGRSPIRPVLSRFYKSLTTEELQCWLEYSVNDGLLYLCLAAPLALYCRPRRPPLAAETCVSGLFGVGKVEKWFADISAVDPPLHGRTLIGSRESLVLLAVEWFLNHGIGFYKATRLWLGC